MQTAPSFQAELRQAERRAALRIIEHLHLLPVTNDRLACEAELRRLVGVVDETLPQ